MFKNNSSNYKTCPLLKKPCIGSDCMWATNMRGEDPQSGAPLDEEGCAIVWLPMLMTQNIQVTHEAGAAVESFRNASQENHQQGLAVMLQHAKVVSISPDENNHQSLEGNARG